MTDFVNFDQIETDLVTLFQNNLTGTEKIGANLNETDYTYANMPLVDVRARRSNPDLTGQQTYYVGHTLEVEVACHDLSSKADAAILRNNLLNQVLQTIRANPRFGAVIDSTVIGPIEFETGEDAKTGAFVSAAVAQITVFTYTQG